LNIGKDTQLVLRQSSSILQTPYFLQTFLTPSLVLIECILDAESFEDWVARLKIFYSSPGTSDRETTNVIEESGFENLLTILGGGRASHTFIKPLANLRNSLQR
jgi:hypothetical protein